jgi:homoserine O-succinyltransferase
MSRKLNIGLVNIMPNALAYEYLLRNSLSSVIDQINIYPIKLETHQYGSSGLSIGHYHSFDELVQKVSLDLLIVTGAPIESLPYEEISYWKELSRIFTYAGHHFKSVMGICFGGLAVAKHLGMNKRVLSEKLYGVYRFSLGAGSGNYFPPDQTQFHMPVSTWAVLDESAAENVAKGKVHGIAHHPETGYMILESNDRKFFMVMGHPEYTVDTLYQEWQRDSIKQIPYTVRFDQHAFTKMKRQLDSETGSLISHWVDSHVIEFESELTSL